MKHLKKAVCILIAAALVVCFAFALVACNNNAKPETMTDADFEALYSFANATSNSQSYRNVTTFVTHTADGDVTEQETCGIYTNNTSRTITIDTVLTAADGTVTKTYYIYGLYQGRTVEAEAEFVGDAELPSSSTYSNTSSLAESQVIAKSSALRAVNDIINLKNYDIISATVINYGDGKYDYEISYGTDDSGQANASIVAHVENEKLISATVTQGDVSYTATYEFNVGSKTVPSKPDWFKQYPAPED